MAASLLARWRARRDRERRTAAYVRALLAEPDADEAEWLAQCATVGDLDHARWELRYARRALGLLSAERDALDDRTGSEVARGLAAGLAADRNVATGKLPIVERQWNARLRAYADALAHREAGETTGGRLGRALLGFCGAGPDPDAAVVARAGDIASRFLADANAALRAAFGEVALPEHVAPSAMRSAGEQRERA